jgi:hypothetical protein
MNIELAVPDEWTPGQTLAVRQLLQHALQTGQRVIALVRNDASEEQLKEIYDRVNALIRDAGLQVS